MPGQPGFPGTVVNPNGAAQSGGGGMVGSGGSSLGGGTTTGSQSGSSDQAQTGNGPYPPQQGQNGMPPGFPQAGGADARRMIEDLLKKPRPGGMPTSNPGGQTFGGGIAGVASTAEGEGVKVYNERTLYEEWEFIFDPAKVKRIPNPNVSGPIGTPAANMPGQQTGVPGMGRQ
jgi:hypothetical protein